MSLVLSLFPGADLLGIAFELEGFCVVQGPDVIFGRDIRNFHPPAGRFDGVIGGPPCQLFSRLKRLNKAAGEKHGNLIPEFQRVTDEASPGWFVMENVEEAPEPVVEGYLVTSVLVDDVAVGGLTSRRRRFSFGSVDRARLYIEMLALHCPNPWPAVCSDARQTPVVWSGGPRRKKKPGIRGNPSPGNGPRLSIAEMAQRQGFAPTLLDEAPFTDSGKRKLIGNGVPLSMGRAIAKAVRKALA